MNLTSGGSMGALPACAPHPSRSQFFRLDIHFHQKVAMLEVGTSQREILDLPLFMMLNNYYLTLSLARFGRIQLPTNTNSDGMIITIDNHK